MPRQAEKQAEEQSLFEQLFDLYREHGEAIDRAAFAERLFPGVVAQVPLDLDLPRRIVGALSSTNDDAPNSVEAVRDLFTRLCELTIHEPMTGLFNRRYFEHRLTQELDRALRQATDCSLMLADIDNFKRINDQYGHSVGDAVIREVGRTLLSNTRPSDDPARYGGEEFALLLPDTSTADALRAGERLRAAVAALPFPQPGVEHQVTVSIGVATARAQTILDAASLVERADLALYRAKDGGKNRVVAYDAPPEAGAVSPAEREALLG
ncbi:MAG: GGDEF domain-containing protein [Deltaproteobacteria bacterium]|nr:GGDEF domain-containing protein [Deltaproteobacteria bacterium]